MFKRAAPWQKRDAALLERKYVDIHPESLPYDEAMQTDKNRAEHALMLYSKLNGIESYCKEQHLSFYERVRIRQEKSVPIFDELTYRVQEQIPKLTTSRSRIGKALAYFLKEKTNLACFCMMECY